MEKTNYNGCHGNFKQFWDGSKIEKPEKCPQCGIRSTQKNPLFLYISLGGHKQRLKGKVGYLCRKCGYIKIFYKEVTK